MGRYVFAASALLLGISSLVMHDQLISNWRLPGTEAFVVVTGIAQIVGAIAMSLRKNGRLGAIVLGVVYLVFSCSFVPGIAAHPNVYASWGNVFYQLALVVGAVVAYATATPALPYATTVGRVAVTLFGLCNISFAIEQIEFLARTVSLVPKWIPPNGTFWAIATTIAFAVDGIALITGYKSLLASRLLTVMLLVFGVAIWIPILVADPSTHRNWSEGIETFAIAAAAWVVADFLEAVRFGAPALLR